MCDEHCKVDHCKNNYSVHPKAHLEFERMRKELDDAEAEFDRLRKKMGSGGRPMIQLKTFFFSVAGLTSEGDFNRLPSTGPAKGKLENLHVEACAAQNTEVQSWIWKMMELDESFDVISVSTHDQFGTPVTTVTFRCSTYHGNDPLFRVGNVGPLLMGPSATTNAEPPAYAADEEELGDAY
jgi:hypothetical protein